MIRHSSSFFISLVFHTILLIILLFAWDSYQKIKKVKTEEKICVKLCKIQKQKPLPKPKPLPKKIKKIKKQPKPKQIVKKIPKKKPKPKPLPKKVEVVKKEPIVVPDIVKEQTIEPEPNPPSVQESEVVEAQPIDPEQDYLDENLVKISQLLQDNLYYPRRARKRRIVGEVIVKFKLSVDASVDAIEIVSSSSEILSRAAKKTINNLAGKFPKPKEELLLQVPINYSLR